MSHHTFRLSKQPRSGQNLKLVLSLSSGEVCAGGKDTPHRDYNKREEASSEDQTSALLVARSASVGASKRRCFQGPSLQVKYTQLHSVLSGINITEKCVLTLENRIFC